MAKDVITFRADAETARMISILTERWKTSESAVLIRCVERIYALETTSKPTYIYGLRDPETKEIRYVGRADNPLVRLERHYRSGGDPNLKPNHPLRLWLESLFKKDLDPEIVIFEETTPLECRERERFWIAKLCKEGSNLTNIGIGGEGRIQQDYENT